MGSKRIGLARIEKLIENLKRELDWNSSSFVEVAGVSTNAQSHITNLHQTAGADLANDTANVFLTTEDHGKTFVCLLAGAGTKSIYLPSGSTVGTTIKIIQGADLVNSGVLRVIANLATLGTNSYAIGYNSSRHLLATRPTEANNTVQITGANTNSAWGIGSTITCTCVATDEWHMEVKAEPLGNGNDGIDWVTIS